MARVVLNVPDISCGHCQMTIEKALGSQSGIQQVQVDIPGKKVILTYDEQHIDLQRVEAVLDEVGYTVQGISSAQE